MIGQTRSLPILDSCAGCGACCEVVSLPPFLRRLDGSGEDAWMTLERDHRPLSDEIRAASAGRRASGEPDYGSPCLWFDRETRLCRHHPLRPRACGEFAIGGTDCRDSRRRQGVL